MDYIPIILAFSSALVAIVGNTWDKNEIGVRKLTASGRFTLALIFFSLIYSLASVYQQHDQKNREELEKKKLGKIISGEVSKSLDAIASPFRHLYMENNGGKYIPEREITFDLMLTEPMLEKAQQELLQAVYAYGLGAWPTPAVHESNATRMLHLYPHGEDAMYFVKVGPPLPRRS